MKFEYGRLSEKRNEEIKNMQIENDYEQYTYDLKYISVVKSEDERYILFDMTPGFNYTREYTDYTKWSKYIFIYGNKYCKFTIMNEDDIRKEKTINGLLYIYQILKIPAIDELDGVLAKKLVYAFREFMQNHSSLVHFIKKCRIFYNNKLMIEEF